MDRIRIKRLVGASICGVFALAAAGCGAPEDEQAKPPNTPMAISQDDLNKQIAAIQNNPHIPDAQKGIAIGALKGQYTTSAPANFGPKANAAPKPAATP